MTSFACPEGERCDEGLCVTDTGCPPPLAPTRIHEEPGADAVVSVLVLDGREYWHGSTADASWFVDARTGVRTSFPHPLGSGGCMGDPVACIYEPQGGVQTVLTDLHLDAGTQTWSYDTVSTPAGYSVFEPHPPSAGGWTLVSLDLHRIATWTPGQGDPEPLIDYGDLTPWNVIDVPGDERRVFFHGAADGDAKTAILSSAPLQKDATVTPFFTLQGGFAGILRAIPAGDGRWFVIHDRPDDSTTYRMWRIDANGATEVGTTSDPTVVMVANGYRSGSPPLEGGARGRGAFCEDDRCHTDRVDFSAGTITPLGVTTLPGAGEVWASGSRWLSCDTAEIIAVEHTPPPSSVTKLHRLRVPRNLAP